MVDDNKLTAILKQKYIGRYNVVTEWDATQSVMVKQLYEARIVFDSPEDEIFFHLIHTECISQG